MIESRNNCSIHVSYNAILQALAGHPSLEALVLMHEDVELRDITLFAKLRALFSDDSVAVVGVIGARGIASLRWWEAETFGRCWETRGLVDFGSGTHDVDIVDGLFLGNHSGGGGAVPRSGR